jgi:hypothetical protein
MRYSQRDNLIARPMKSHEYSLLLLCNRGQKKISNQGIGEPSKTHSDNSAAEERREEDLQPENQPSAQYEAVR